MKSLATCLLLLLSSARVTAVQAAEPVQFARDVLPILSANCYACHGPDPHERQAELRLDVEDDAKRNHDSGFPIVPGKPERSVVIKRLLSKDPDEVMPPPASHRQLKPEQIETIRRWVVEGAKWQRHWSFEPVVKPPGTLDDLVRAELAKKSLRLREAAAPQTLVRRLSLDLIGLPPTPEEADRFARDSSSGIAAPAAYAKLVDDLLAKPQFGEHWARMWLDLARYADTKGYEKDLGRTMWPYRDWVVNALNADMPLDQFTIEQLAGDLLPSATDQQVIATAFHRNTMSNDEGGTDDEEFRVAAVKDRVDTTIQVWMGLTMGCAKCHTHKYDPIANDDYYRLYAIFNQTQDADRYDDSPRFEVLSPSQRTEREALQAKASQLDADLRAAETALPAKSATDNKWTPLRVVEASSSGGATLTPTPEQAVAVTGKAEVESVYKLTCTLGAGKHTAFRLEALPAKFPDGQFGLGRNPDDPNFVVSDLTVELLDGDTGGDAGRPIKLINPRSDFSQEGWNVKGAIDGDEKTGWAVSPRSRERHVALFDFAERLKLDAEAKVRVTITQKYGNRLVLALFRLSTSEADPATLAPDEEPAEIRKLREGLTAVRKAIETFNGAVPQLPIMRELTADHLRPTKIHKRGNFLDLGDAVQPAVLRGFGPVPADEPPSRLSVARWLVSRENPLSPRVFANRIWARLLGQGLVETEEDFGALGAPPSNPALLDWLAAEYRDGGWSLKKLLKTIVMSDTYRQTSESTASLREADPRNVLQSRGARYRLSAEIVRDQALAVSGLLSPKMGGPAVMPPQPSGMWRSTYNGQKWVDAEGEDRFRRGLYTYLKRTTPYPSFTMFDGGSGEVCQIRRIRTNTPLQALVTLNDPVYFEAAAGLARRMVNEAQTAEDRVARGLRLALVRPVREGEAAPLVRLQRDAQDTFVASPESAATLIKTSRGDKGDMAPHEFAAWIVTANAILNLDEFLTRN